MHRAFVSVHFIDEMKGFDEIPNEILEKVLILASAWIEDSINISRGKFDNSTPQKLQLIIFYN